MYAATARFLVGLGHEVIPAAQLGLAQADDEVLLRTAQIQERIFMTRDRDFGGLVFLKALGAGVIYLRVLPATLDIAHKELERVINTYSEDEIRQAFIVVEPDGHRFRKLPKQKSQV